MVSSNDNQIYSSEIESSMEDLYFDFECLFDDHKEELKETLKEEYEEYVKTCNEEEEEPLDIDDWLEEEKGLDKDQWIKENVDMEEYNQLKDILNEVGSDATLINENYFTEAMEELCKDIGDVPNNLPSYIVIDWEETAENLRSDYSSIEYDGVTFYYR